MMQAQESNIFRHYVATTAERDGTMMDYDDSP